ANPSRPPVRTTPWPILTRRRMPGTDANHPSNTGDSGAARVGRGSPDRTDEPTEGLPLVTGAESPEPPRLHVVLVEPEIAANTGSIGRTCVAAGAMLWLVRPLGFHLDDRYLRRAALDYWPHLDWRVVDGLGEVVAALGRDRLWSFSTKATRVYTDVRYGPGEALVFGPE